MGEKYILLGIGKPELQNLCFYQFAQRIKKYIYEISIKKTDCHSLQTLHWHYKAVYTTNVVTRCFRLANVHFLLVEDVELDHYEQQYILVQNDLNNKLFTSLLQ